MPFEDGQFDQADLVSMLQSATYGTGLPASWSEGEPINGTRRTRSYPLPSRFEFSGGTHAGQISLSDEWLRFDRHGDYRLFVTSRRLEDLPAGDSALPSSALGLTNGGDDVPIWVEDAN